MQKGWLTVMNLLIDTNVILNMVFKRNGFDDAVQLFRKIKESNNNVFITASTVTDTKLIIQRSYRILYDVQDNFSLEQESFLKETF